MENKETSKFEMRDCLNIIKMKYYIIIIICILSVVGMCIYTKYFFKPECQSEEKLVIITNNSNKPSQINYNDLLLNQNLVKTYANIITTSKVLQDTANMLNTKMTVQDLEKRITVDSQSEIFMINIKVKGDNLEQSRDILKKLNLVFKKEVKDIFNIDNIQILDTNEIPPKLISIKQSVLYGVIIGVLLSLGIIFIVEFMNDNIKKQEDFADRL